MLFLKMLAAILVMCVVAAIGLFVSYPWLYPTYAVRYRLTVNAIVGAQPHSGSSVIEIRVKTQPNLLDNPRWAFRVDGEATFVDLGDGRNLVALLNSGPTKGKGSDAITILFRAFDFPFNPDNAADLPKLDGERRLQPADWPSFATFPDVSDALSVKAVDASALQDTYGAGARIESVTVSITHDPVTHSLEQNLPSLGNAPQDHSDPKTIAMVKLHLGRSAFIRSDP
jgi:hypothetical protein